MRAIKLCETSSFSSVIPLSLSGMRPPSSIESMPSAQPEACGRLGPFLTLDHASAGETTVQSHIAHVSNKCFLKPLRNMRLLGKY
eukprot:5497067-Amphidinium_carterae.1